MIKDNSRDGDDGRLAPRDAIRTSREEGVDRDDRRRESGPGSNIQLSKEGKPGHGINLDKASESQVLSQEEELRQIEEEERRRQRARELDEAYLHREEELRRRDEEEARRREEEARRREEEARRREEEARRRQEEEARRLEQGQRQDYWQQWGSQGGVQRQVGFGEAIKMGFSKYATFSGRSSRSEFWYWALFNVLVEIGLLIVFSGLDGDALLGLLCVMMLPLVIPSLAVAVRRLHDVGKSGWWYLLGLIPVVNYVGAFYLLYLFCQPSQDQPNNWGEVPNVN